MFFSNIIEHKVKVFLFTTQLNQHFFDNYLKSGYKYKIFNL